ncbi:MAG: MaoC/PaaZ C-terminal domain-containing protein [Thermodesulfobacteriota bacterium]
MTREVRKTMQGFVDFQGLAVGDPLPPLTKPPITKVQLVRYAGASGDFNPIHTDDEAARRSGLKGVIAHGLLVMGFVGEAVATWAPRRCLKRLSVRFSGMTYPGDVITLRATLNSKEPVGEGVKVICGVSASDQKGEVKLSGQFELLIPHTEA